MTRFLFHRLTTNCPLFHSFTTRLGTIPAGVATVTATGDGRVGTTEVSWAAKTC